MSVYRQKILEAHIDYCDELGKSAFVAVVVDDNCDVPNHPTKPEVILYDLASEAVRNFEIVDGIVKCEAMFDDGAHSISFPVGNVVGLYPEDEPLENRLQFLNILPRKHQEVDEKNEIIPTRPKRVK